MAEIRKGMKPKQPLSVEKAVERLENLCMRAEHCTYEVRQKLYRWKINPEAGEKIISHLVKQRFVDDQRFARAFVNDKARFAGWGPRKIYMALIVKRINSETINQALAEVDDALFDNKLIELLQTKSKSLTEPNSFEGRTKLFRYGVSRGFAPDKVSSVIKIRFV